MFVNEFGQTVKADWVLISTTTSSLETLAQNIIKSTCGGFANVSVDCDGEYLGMHIVDMDSGVEDELSSKGINTDRPLHVADTFIRWIFGQTAVFHEVDDDGDPLIRIDFNDYISRTFGM